MSAIECKPPKVAKAPKHQTAATGGLADNTNRIAHQRDIFKRIRTRDVCRTTRQLATLLRAGMPIVPALSALVEQLGDEPLAEIIKDICDDVNAGSSLADAMKKYPDVFSRMFVNMVAAGETSGTLEDVLLRIAEMFERRNQLVGKVKAAVAYPLMMIVVAAAVVVFLLSFVVPTITDIFIEMNRPLPWPTRLLIATSAFMKSYLVLITVVIFVAVMGFAAWLKTEEGGLIWGRAKLKIPLFGGLFLKLEISRLARTLGILLVSGIPILAALEIAKGVVQNSFIAGTLDSVKKLVSRGNDVADAFRKTGLFPPIVFHIIATGQMSGNIEEGLINIADMYDGEVETTAKMLVSLLEPAILLIMGIIVGFIVLSILLPIFEINQAI